MASLASLALALALVPAAAVQALAADAEDVGAAALRVLSSTTASGTCGDDLTWVFDSDGTLTISGSGAMSNYTESTLAPWNSYASSITAVVIDGFVTSIGSYAFYYCSSMTSVTISDSVTSIGENAFNECTSLAGVDPPSSLASIEDSVDGDDDSGDSGDADDGSDSGDFTDDDGDADSSASSRRSLSAATAR